MARMQDYSYTPLGALPTIRKSYYLLGALATVLVTVWLAISLLSLRLLDLSSPIIQTQQTASDVAYASIHNSTLGVSALSLLFFVGFFVGISQLSLTQFERVLAISLPERRDHRDALSLASAVSGFHIDFIDGVHGESVASKSLPPIHEDFPMGTIGSWRAHMNAISQVVENGWSTALIFEDDVDWDIRLKSIFQDFAVASDAVLKTSSPGVAVLEDSLPDYAPTHSPYGSDWDILWLGHCYMEIDNETGPVVLTQYDETVPAIRYISTFDPNKPTPMYEYPEHSRAVFRHKAGVCSLAYAVSQAGARALLREVGLNQFNAPFDLMLQHFCDGTYGIDRSHSCLGVLPQIFDHYRDVGPVSKDSDISAGADESMRDQAFTPNIRWSVRLNMDKILDGDTDYVDQYPD